MSNVVLYATAADEQRYPLKCTTDGVLSVSSGGGGGGGVVQIEDSNGDAILATNSALDVNVKGVNITSNALNVNVTNTAIGIKNTNGSDIYLLTVDDQLQCDGRVYSSDGTGVTASFISETSVGLDVAACLYTTNGDVINALTSTVVDEEKIALDTNITNTMLNTKVYGNDGTDDVVLYLDSKGHPFVHQLDNAINEAPIDLVLQKAIYSTWSTYPPLPDPIGREGWWFYNNAQVQNWSVFGYINALHPTTLAQKFMTKTQLKDAYFIITPDILDYDILSMPIIAVYSFPTGSGDASPNYRSVWYYRITSEDFLDLRSGETILVHIGNRDPELRSNVPGIKYAFNSGEGPQLNSEIIKWIRLEASPPNGTDCQILVQNFGFFDQSLGRTREVAFLNSKKRLEETALSELRVVSDRLKVETTGTVSTTSVSNRNGEISNVKNGGNIVGGGGVSNQVIITNYGKNSFFSYQDDNINSLEPVYLFGFELEGGIYSMPILKLSPSRPSGSTFRYGYSYIDLSPFRKIQIINNSSETFTNVYATVFSG
jgi:hypothetical protein